MFKWFTHFDLLFGLKSGQFKDLTFHWWIEQFMKQRARLKRRSNNPNVVLFGFEQNFDRWLLCSK